MIMMHGTLEGLFFIFIFCINEAHASLQSAISQLRNPVKLRYDLKSVGQVVNSRKRDVRESERERGRERAGQKAWRTQIKKKNANEDAMYLETFTPAMVNDEWFGRDLVANQPAFIQLQKDELSRK